MKTTPLVRTRSLVLGAAAALCAAPSSAQLPAEMTARVANTRAGIMGCLSQGPQDGSPPAMLDLVVNATPGGAMVQLLNGPRGAVRGCIEGTVQQGLTPLPVPPGTALRIQIPLAAAQGYAAGQPIDAFWGAAWYPASVLSVQSDGSVNVHYDGWSSTSDEALPPDRVRPRGGVAPQPPPPVIAVVQAPAMQPPPQQQQQGMVLVPPQGMPPQGDDNIVVNGGFEAPGVQQGSAAAFPQLPGWVLTGGRSIEVQANAAGAPAEGRQFVELDSDAPSAIAQDLRTQPGARYEVRVSFSARPGTNLADNRVRVLWDGAPLGLMQADGSGRNQTSWATVTFYVNANGRRSRLELRDEGTPNSVGSYVDDVRVTLAR